jgi:hypothetical protein
MRFSMRSLVNPFSKLYRPAHARCTTILCRNEKERKLQYEKPIKLSNQYIRNISVSGYEADDERREPDFNFGN